ncbi:hypothetical protein K501DRAFT_275997 [Backusella circina FSU 941]|nr:hypothetical protein K501DRAFT_275997 [Backusella circina FSU 941]
MDYIKSISNNVITFKWRSNKQADLEVVNNPVGDDGFSLTVTNCSVEINFEDYCRMVIILSPLFQIQPLFSERTSSFTEVTIMLKDKCIDLGPQVFFLSCQVPSLKKTKGKDGSEDGFLEYLEDIIGTSVYKKAY